MLYCTFPLPSPCFVLLGGSVQLSGTRAAHMTFDDRSLSPPSQNCGQSARQGSFPGAPGCENALLSLCLPHPTLPSRGNGASGDHQPLDHHELDLTGLLAGSDSGLLKLSTSFSKAC